MMNASIVLVLLLVLYNTVDCMSKNGNTTCSPLIAVHQSIPQALLLRNPTAGRNLKICRSNLTCCSNQMENELYMKSSRVLKDAVHQQTNETHHFLTTQGSLFDDYFRDLLQTAKVKWHEMLLLTYKDVYIRNRHIFDDFFSTIERYYVYGDVDIDYVCNIFFQKIQSTMFTLINTKLANQPGFLNCSAKHIGDIKPFGRYPARVTDQLRSTLMRARNFVVGLQVGSNATRAIMSYMSRNECKEGFTKIQHCSICEGIPNALTCNATCHNLLQSCFFFDPLFEKYWSDYIRGLHVLSSELDGQYDVEAVFGQLAYDISSAIMEFQSNFINVLAKAKTICSAGRRRKRAIDKSGSDLYLEGESRRRNDSVSLPKQRPPSLDTFTTAFRQDLTGLKDVWRYLPQKICGVQTSLARDHSASCWNGIEMQKNSEKVPGLRINNADGSRQSIMKELQNWREAVDNFKKDPGNTEQGNENIDVDASGEPDFSDSGSGSGGGSASGSGVEVTTVIANPRTTPELPKISSSTSDPGIEVIFATSGTRVIPDATDPSVTASPATTSQNKVTSTTDESILVHASTDGSGAPIEEYETTTKTSLILVSKPSIDDEDLEISGSGENDTLTDVPMTDSKILFHPTIDEEDPRVFVKNILGTPDVDRSTGNMKSISYLLAFLVTLVGLANV